MYLSASAALLLLANHAIAQSSSVISIWAFDLDAPTLLASLVDANPTANVLAIQCPPGTDSAVCDVPGVVTITEGPSTLRAVYTVAADVVYRASETFISGSVTVTLECARRVVTQAVCTYAGEGEGVTTSTVITVTDTDISSVPVTITAGLEKLASTASAAGAQATDAGLSGSVPSGTATATAPSGSIRPSSETMTGPVTSSTQSTAAGKNLEWRALIAGLAGAFMAPIALSGF